MMSAAVQSHLNPVSPQNLLNPIPLYKELRENDPVHWSDMAQAWFITRHRDVMNCFRDPRLSSDRTKFFQAQLQGLNPEIIKDLLDSSSKQMIMKDGAEHIRLRRQALAAFTPQMVESWRPMIHRILEELLVPLLPRRRMDLVQEISHQLPALVISEILGIPAADRTRFQAWAEAIILFVGATPGADIPTVARQANTAMAELRGYLTELAEKRRLSPGEDVISRMLQVQAENARMTFEELVLNSLLILNAGHLTTTDQLSNGVYDLLSNPEQLRLLRADPGLLRSAVEEMLRYSPSVPFMPRIALENFQLHGRNIRKGDVLLLGMASANRDPEIFPDPDRFDITRGIQSRHLSFAFGQHQCLGAGLARREMEIVIETLVQRMPDLGLDEEHTPRRKCFNLASRGFESLHLRW